MAYSIVKPIGCYVYTHRKATTGDIFYVGKGTAERAWDRYGRSPYWRHVADKHGVVIEIEAEGLLEFEAHARERDLISVLKAKGVRLANLTDGGEGSLNPSDETRAKISAFQKGRKKSPEHIEKIRQANAGKTRSEETKKKIRDRVVSDEAKARMSAAGKARTKATAETLLRLSDATRKKWESSEYRAKMLASTTGKKRDDAFRDKLRTIAKSRPPKSEEERERASAQVKELWANPEYRARMKAAHSGKPWSEARRSALQQRV